MASEKCRSDYDLISPNLFVTKKVRSVCKFKNKETFVIKTLTRSIGVIFDIGKLTNNAQIDLIPLLIVDVTMLIYLFILAAGSTVILAEETDHCIWYGICYTDDYGKNFNCPNTTTGQPIEDPTAIDTLKRYCPELYTDRNTNLFFYMIFIQINALFTFFHNNSENIPFQSIYSICTILL